MPSVSDGNFLLNLYEQQETPRAARAWRAVAAAGIVLMIALRLALISVPLERDEGGYAYIADRWLHGETPYVDALETKPPGVFAAYAVILLFGRSVPTIRFAGLLMAAVTALLLWRLVRRVYGVRAAGLATAMTALLMLSPAYLGFTLNSEMVMVPLILGALLLLPIGAPARGIWSFLLCGVLLGAAVLVKPVAMTESLLVAAVIVLGEGPARKKILRLLAVALGSIAAFLLCVAWFAAQNAAGEMLYWAFAYNLQYSADVSFPARVQTLVYRLLFRGMLIRDWPIWLAAVFGVVALARSQRTRLTRAFPLLWFCSSFLGVAASGRWTGHYFQQWLPAVGLIAALGVERILDAINLRLGAPWSNRALTGLTLALVLLYPPLVEAKSFLAGRELARMTYGLNPFVEGETVGRYLAAHTAPDETIFVFGTEGEFLFHAQRRSAQRFVFTYPLGSSHPRALEWQRQALDEVRRNNPRYIVVVNLTPSFYLTDRAPKFLQEETAKLVAAQYSREAAVIALDKRHTVFLTDRLPVREQAPAVVDIYRRR